MLKALPSLLLLFSLVVPSHAQDFWKHWGDGKAELNGYVLKQPRYGALRTGTADPHLRHRGLLRLAPA